MIRTAAAVILVGVCTTVFAQAPAAPQVRIRGNVEKLDGNTLTVKSRSGETMPVKLADNVVVMGIHKASVNDIQSGKFIGTTTVGERNGALVALEVHIFPENMRGTGEGHRDWDLRPQSKMTNANVAQIKSVGADHEMTVQYKGGEQKVLVTAQTQVVSYAPASKDDLKPGAAVFVIATKDADGSLSAPRVNVGMNGQMPPM